MIDYEQALDHPVAIRDGLPPDHLARFIVKAFLGWI
jgi:hypothetical protein